MDRLVQCMVQKMQIARGMALAWPIPKCRMRSRVAAHIRKMAIGVKAPVAKLISNLLLLEFTHFLNAKVESGFHPDK